MYLKCQQYSLSAIVQCGPFQINVYIMLYLSLIRLLLIIVCIINLNWQSNQQLKGL